MGIFLVGLILECFLPRKVREDEKRGWTATAAETLKAIDVGTLALLAGLFIVIDGLNRVGIIAGVCTALADFNVNVLDISQTVLQEYFTMVMLVDLSACTASIGEMSDLLEQAGREQGLSIRIQREDIFNAMHRI